MGKKNKTFEGLPVVDADKAVQLTITKADINGSRKNDPANCAAARAGKREYKKDVRVFLTRTYIKEKKHWVRFINPQSVSREITSFDRGSSFEPGEYVVVPASKHARLGEHRGYSYEKDKTRKHKKPHHMTAQVRQFDNYEPKASKSKK